MRRLMGILVVGTSLFTAGCKEEEKHTQDNTNALEKPKMPLFMSLKIGEAPVSAGCFSQLAWEEGSEAAEMKEVSACQQTSFLNQLCEGEKNCQASVETAEFKDFCAQAPETCFSWKRTQGGGNEKVQEQGAIRYHYLGEYKKKPIVFVEENTGGTGIFSSILSVVTEGNKFSPDHVYASGDRCNGGIVYSTLKEGRLIYHQNVTPLDMLGIEVGETDADKKTQRRIEEMSGEGMLQFPASAAACAGEAVYEDERLTGLYIDRVFFEEDLKAGDEASADAGLVNCFDKTILVGLKEKKGAEVFISIGEYLDILNKFDETCLAQKE